MIKRNFNSFTSTFSKALYSFCLLIVLFINSIVNAADQNWTGTWNTVWRDDGAQLTLEQSGNTVQGFYQPYDGAIIATVQGDSLTGEWIQENRRGRFIFTMAPDGKTFLGRFDTGEWWNGERVSVNQQISNFKTDLSTPMNSLKSFLINSNFVYSGHYEYSIEAQKSLSFDLYPSISPRDKALVSKQFFTLIDQTTLRVWDYYQVAEGSKLDAKLKQDGTDITVPITFNQTIDKQWKILVPSQREMAGKLQQLLDARNIKALEKDDHLKLSNPRDTIRTFIQQVDKWERGGKEYVMSTMDLSQISPSILEQEAAIRAEYLKHILDRITFIIWQEIPNDPSSTTPYVYFMHPLGDIIIEPYKENDKTLWRFNADTIKNVKNLHLAFENMPLVDGLVKETQIKPFFQIRQTMRSAPWLMMPFLGAEVWQLLLLLVIAGVSWLVSIYLARVIIVLFQWIRKTLRIKSGHRKVTKFYGPIRIILIALTWLLTVELLGLPENWHLIITWVSDFTLIWGLGWMAIRLTDWFGEHHRTHTKKTESHMDDIMVSLVVGLVKVLIIAISAVMISRAMAIPYQNILAGLGIGGLAVAFAARETIADFFGSAVLLADRPFRQNDRVNIGEVQGYVEYVGLRSTQIRTLDDSLVTIPNSRLAHEIIDNRRKRTARHLKTQLSVTLDTPLEKIEAFIENIKALMIKHEANLNDEVHCGIWEFGSYSIDLQLFCYLKASSREEEYKARNTLLREIIKLSQEMSIEFAYPTRTLYMQELGKHSEAEK